MAAVLACGDGARLSHNDGDAVIDAIPVTSPPRTYVDVAADLAPARLHSLLEQGQRRDLVDAAELDAELRACNGHRGLGLLRAALVKLDGWRYHRDRERSRTSAGGTTC